MASQQVQEVLGSGAGDLTPARWHSGGMGMLAGRNHPHIPREPGLWAGSGHQRMTAGAEGFLGRRMKDGVTEGG